MVLKILYRENLRPQFCCRWSSAMFPFYEVEINKTIEYFFIKLFSSSSVKYQHVTFLRAIVRFSPVIRERNDFPLFLFSTFYCLFKLYVTEKSRFNNLFNFIKNFFMIKSNIPNWLLST
jgi:hypothetical protein